MKPRTRDNLIYLAVGLSVAALAVAAAFYTDSRGRKISLPSKFAIRSVYTTALIWYVVLRGIREAKQTFLQVFSLVLFATLLHLTIVFTARHVIEQLPGFAFAALWVPEMYLVFYMTDKCSPYLTWPRH